MSLQMTIARTYLRTTRKPKAGSTDWQRMQRDSAPWPQPKIRTRHEIEELRVGEARAVWLRNPSAQGTIVYAHGGGYIFGPTAEHWEWLSHTTRATQTNALVLDYRLAPQHPFPAGLDDALHIVRTLQDEAILTPGSWVLGGDSAGGGLSLAVAHALRDEGRALPAGLLLQSPWIDLRDRDYPQAAADPWLAPDGTRLTAEAYAGGTDRGDVGISPLANRHDSLPPVYLEEASDDILVTEGRELADALRAVGNDVSYNEAPGCFHVYPLVGWLPESRVARARQAAWIKARLS